MPIITVAVTRPLDKDFAHALATTITGLTRTHLKKDPTVTAVALTYIDPSHWFAGGQSLASQSAQTFWLDIKVVDGTNTKPELAAYLDHVFAAMSGLLGQVHSESYVLVHEVPASAYGFGGKTQEFRFIARQLAPAT